MRGGEGRGGGEGGREEVEGREVSSFPITGGECSTLHDVVAVGTLAGNTGFSC